MLCPQCSILSATAALVKIFNLYAFFLLQLHQHDNIRSSSLLTVQPLQTHTHEIHSHFSAQLQFLTPISCLSIATHSGGSGLFQIQQLIKLSSHQSSILSIFHPHQLFIQSAFCPQHIFSKFGRGDAQLAQQARHALLQSPSPTNWYISASPFYYFSTFHHNLGTSSGTVGTSPKRPSTPSFSYQHISASVGRYDGQLSITGTLGSLDQAGVVHFSLPNNNF